MQSSLFKSYPEIDKITSYSKGQEASFANMHIHTPYSFSAFKNVGEAINLAHDQNVKVLGISDFNTTQGYEEFTKECLNAKIFPAYGMETIALSVEDQKSAFDGTIRIIPEGYISVARLSNIL